MADRELAAERLARAIAKGERVVVFGDYDVDGTTSALILSEILQALGGEVRTLVADRFVGGYGLSDAALDRCLAEGPGVLVTCDCGSSDHERIRRARAQGIDVLVVDHHLVPEEPLPALAFLNPHRPDCDFPYKGMCSAGLALSLGAAVRAKRGASLDVRRWLDLVALGTIADVAPLDGDNRRLVRAGLKMIGSTQARPAVQALRRVAKVPASPHLTAEDIAFRFAPRINAPGRLGASELTLRFLQAGTVKEAQRLADEVEAHNDKRKELTASAFSEALAQAQEIYGEAPEAGVVVASESWHRGIVGIIAARLVDALRQPVVVIALDGELGHGSVRTCFGIDVHRALQRCASTLHAFGGHRAAAGLSIRPNRLEGFRAAFEDATRSAAKQEQGPVEIELALGGAFEIPSVSDLMRLGPFGEAHQAPLFLVEPQRLRVKGVGADNAHAKLEIGLGDSQIRGFGPGLFSRLQGRSAVRLVGEFQPDHWMGGESIEFLVKDVLEP
jgi:single-stranded-DNA-specific exonuclease